jgi:hypothetical protein
MSAQSRFLLAACGLLAALFIMVGCQTQPSSVPKKGVADKTKRVTLEVTGMS